MTKPRGLFRRLLKGSSPASGGSPPPGMPQEASPMHSNAGNGLAILTLCMFAAGLVVLGWGVFEVKRALDSQRWPATTGIVTLSTLHTVDRRKENQTEVTYYPKVHYSYAVFGQHYTADRIAFGGSSGGSQSKSQKVVDEYPEGRDVTVFYNPDDPSVAVLKAGYSLAAYVMVAAGMVFGAGGMLCLRAWRRKQERKNIYLGK